MAASISDRINRVHGSINQRSESLQGGESGLQSDGAAGQAGGPQLHDELIRLLRDYRKLGESMVVGSTRFGLWNEDSQKSFFKVAERIKSSPEYSAALAISPWKLAGQSTPTDFLSLDAPEFRLDPTLVSRLLRELPVWKKHRPLILIDLGQINSIVSQALAPWCDATIVLSQGTLSTRNQEVRAIRAWLKAGFHLNAAVHVA
jgi:hypothetical protein